MAKSITLPLHGFSSHSSFTSCMLRRHYKVQKPLISTLTSLSLHCISASSKKLSSRGFLHPLRSSFEGIPSEFVEDSKFVPLNADDPVYGPPALLLLGFEIDETNEIQKFLKAIDGEFMKIIHCTEEMLNQSVWDAVNTEQPSLEAVKIAKSLPRICLLSGLSGEEMMMFIDAFPETGLKEAVFAAVVPNSADKLLSEVVEEIMGDHEMLSAQNSS
ncbi:uncharacterized protein LOC120270921 [Dioscorea cayenensis subsp. rotundata]|uniref:Uncharacterized protein LOC120270921 n=1 Tax=Dioscorea cayennensis subsp. rotundata TaxID=55577 RepID=A0AB40C566_DIOCR|nr:uncharacterized protein LOC120270921 [Dioscorea cayenensis subsp. rotundata]